MITEAIVYCRQRIRDGDEAISELAYSTQMLRERVEDSANEWNDERGRLLRDKHLRTTTEGAEAQLASFRRSLATSESVLGPLAIAAANDKRVETQIEQGHRAVTNARSIASDSLRAIDAAHVELDAADSRTAHASSLLFGL
jgi:hypothetical protein